MNNQSSTKSYYIQQNRMEEVIMSYLRMETSYALLINGSKGLGKTFFIKNSIAPKISLVKVYHDNQKTYKSIYISLYGIKSINEIFTLLAIEFIPWIKSKGVKISLSVGKLFVRGLLNFKGGGALEEYLNEVSDTAKTAIDTKDFVIIFDDLDRISKSLEINEVIGFINSLVEHENNKIIVIADEDNIADNGSYVKVREKTIGTIIEYSNTFSEIYDAIINSKYRFLNHNYYGYLQKLKSDILVLFSVTGTKNLRILIYLLEHFYVVFNGIYTDLNLQVYDPESLNYKKLRLSVEFATAISIEFKNGRLTYNQTNGIDDMKTINKDLYGAWLQEYFTKGQVQRDEISGISEKPFTEIFLDKYYKNKTYDFYSSLFRFFTGGDSFDKLLLLDELKLTVDDRLINPTPQDDIYNNLTEPNVYDLSEDEFIVFNQRMLEFAYAGAYPLDRYISILYYLQRFPQIKKYNIDEESKRLIEGVKVNRNKFQHDEILPEKFPINSTVDSYEVYLNLFQTLNEVNISIKQKTVTSRRLDLFELFKNDPEHFYKEVNMLNIGTPIFSYWNFEDFYQVFTGMKPSSIPRFTKFIQDWFNQIESIDKLELTFLETFFNNLCKQDEGYKITLQTLPIETLSSVLLKFLKKNWIKKNTPIPSKYSTN